MMSFIQQFYQDCLVKFALMGICPLQANFLKFPLEGNLGKLKPTDVRRQCLLFVANYP